VQFHALAQLKTRNTLANQGNRALHHLTAYMPQAPPLKQIENT